MISHKYKCIFIHIAKCAGTSIEYAFGVDVENYNAEENNQLFGWDKANNIWIQHATPQQLIDLNYISQDHWNTYYKFIVYRNSWDRAYSDYLWMKNAKRIQDSFKNFINKKGNFEEVLTNTNSRRYAGDHLYLQKDYFFLNGKKVNYDNIINFEYLNEGLKKVVKDLNLSNDFFSVHLNRSKAKKSIHYSKFYNTSKQKLVYDKYKEDINFFNFKFCDKKTIIDRFKVNAPRLFNN